MPQFYSQQCTIPAPWPIEWPPLPVFLSSRDRHLPSPSPQTKMEEFHDFWCMLAFTLTFRCPLYCLKVVTFTQGLCMLLWQQIRFLFFDSPG